MAMSQCHPKRVDPPVDQGVGAELAFELGGWSCRIVRLEDVKVSQRATRSNGRTPERREVAHFELGEHSYALTAELPAPAERANAGATFPDSDADDVHSRLTNRELQIVQLICMGLLTKQVANRLRISEFTVRSYLKTIYCKLGVRSRGAMVYEYTQVLARIRPGDLNEV